MGRNHPSTLDVKHPFHRRKTNISEYIRFVILNKNLARYRTDRKEYTGSSFLSLFCWTPSLFDIPENTNSKEFLIENFNDKGEFFARFATIAGLWNVVISPSVLRKFDLMEGTLFARTLVKSPLFFQMGTLDTAIRPVKSSPVKSAELTSSPSRFCDVNARRCQISELEISERSSSTTSTSSCQSTSSPCPSVSRGLLHCVRKNGSAYFVFTVDVDHSKVYVANPWKIESSINKALDYMYLFSKKECGNNGSKASDFVGKMKVSSSLVLDSNRSKLLETQFVLFGANEDHVRVMQSSGSTVGKSKGSLSKKMADIFRPNHPSKDKSTCKIEEFLREPRLSQLCGLDESVMASRVVNDFQSNLELAAIVMKDKQHDSNKEAATGGWGLKFLEKVRVDHGDTSLEPSLPSERCINVLVPAGFHGDPVARGDGPSSLIERWRSGGHCDCGGWDVGCPLTVLHNSKSFVSKSFQEESQEDCKSFDLFIEGAEHGLPTLKLVHVNEDRYIMYFQSSLSALLSFSIGVAIIHTQTPSLCTKL